jgi:hypothetical protein
MVCWPDVWEHLRRELPLIEVWTSLSAYLALVGLLLWAPKLKKQWMKITSRVLGFVGIAPLPLLLFGFMLGTGNPPPQKHTVKSLNGAEATLNYEAGFLGRDFTEVLLKENDCCRHRQVFWYAGPGYFDSTQMQWTDNNHLQISYHARPSDPVHCEQISEKIVITCTRLQWPTAPASGISSEPSNDVSKEMN